LQKNVAKFRRQSFISRTFCYILHFSACPLANNNNNLCCLNVTRIQSTNLIYFCRITCVLQISSCCLTWFWTQSGSSPLNWHIHIRLILKLHFITVIFFDYLMKFPFISRNVAIFLFNFVKFSKSLMKNFAEILQKIFVAKFRIAKFCIHSRISGINWLSTLFL
jgi:hypothetical protein